MTSYTVTLFEINALTYCVDALKADFARKVAAALFTDLNDPHSSTSLGLAKDCAPIVTLAAPNPETVREAMIERRLAVLQ